MANHNFFQKELTQRKNELIEIKHEWKLKLQNFGDVK